MARGDEVASELEQLVRGGSVSQGGAVVLVKIGTHHGTGRYVVVYWATGASGLGCKVQVIVSWTGLEYTALSVLTASNAMFTSSEESKDSPNLTTRRDRSISFEIYL